MKKSVDMATADKDTVRELTIWAENTETIWRRMEATAKSMAKKSQRQEMRFDTLEKSSVVASIARQTANDYRETNSLPRLSAATSAQLRHDIAEQIWELYEYEVKQ